MTHHIPEGLPDRIRHYIDGEFVDSVGGETFDTGSSTSKVSPPTESTDFPSMWWRMRSGSPAGM